MKFKCIECEYETDNEFSICPVCGRDNKEKSAFSKLGDIFSSTKEIISQKSSEIFDEDTMLGRHAKKVSEKVSRTYEETGSKNFVDTAFTVTGEKLDIVSGQAMYELVQERLALQDRYNNVLATKLHEALEKIKELEEKISKITTS